MSMPSFPENGANMTREQALTMIIASVAMEEQALGGILRAEGEKLRCILDRYKDACGGRGTPKEILDANRSVTRLLEVVAQNQMVLRDKLALALDAGGQYPPGPPCPPPEPPCPEPEPQPPCPEPQPPCPEPEPQLPCPPPDPPCPPPDPPCPFICPRRRAGVDTLEL